MYRRTKNESKITLEVLYDKGISIKTKTKYYKLVVSYRLWYNMTFGMSRQENECYTAENAELDGWRV